jgi:hypothetical protein
MASFLSCVIKESPSPRRVHICQVLFAVFALCEVADLVCCSGA